MKSATVTVIGRPSAGKSTLVNTISGMKVSITAKTPQTTRKRIKGIYTDGRGQLVFVDTPGYHISGKEMNKRLQKETLDSLEDTDIILYVIDGKRKAEIEKTLPAEVPHLFISSVSGENIQELKDLLWKTLQEQN